MSTDDDDSDDAIEYRVVVNDEEQYAIWPLFRDVPPGWRAVGPSGPKTICLEWIEQTWTDMRPLSLRKALDGREAT